MIPTVQGGGYLNKAIQGWGLGRIEEDGAYGSIRYQYHHRSTEKRYVAIHEGPWTYHRSTMALPPPTESVRLLPLWIYGLLGLLSLASLALSTAEELALTPAHS